MPILISHENWECMGFARWIATTARTKHWRIWWICRTFSTRKTQFPAARIGYLPGKNRIRKSKTNMALIGFSIVIASQDFHFFLDSTDSICSFHSSLKIERNQHKHAPSIHAIFFFLNFRFLQHTTEREQNNREMLTIIFGSSGISSNSISIIFCRESILILIETSSKWFNTVCDLIRLLFLWDFV